jgi:hypothetical protein
MVEPVMGHCAALINPNQVRFVIQEDFNPYSSTFNDEIIINFPKMITHFRFKETVIPEVFQV